MSRSQNSYGKLSDRSLQTETSDCFAKFSLTPAESELINEAQAERCMSPMEYFEYAMKLWIDPSIKHPRTYYIAPCRPLKRRSFRVSEATVRMAENVRLFDTSGNRVNSQKATTLLSAVFWAITLDKKKSNKGVDKPLFDAGRPKIPVRLQA